MSGAPLFSGRIGVLMGGCSSEREISLQSGEAVVKAFQAEDLDVIPIDLKTEDPDNLKGIITDGKIDIVFIALHGRFGEDGTVQSVLEDMRVPFTGSGVNASRTAFNKALTQKFLKSNDIPVPPFKIIKEGGPFDGVFGDLGGSGVVVKPASEGSSIGISIVTAPDQLQAALALAWKYDGFALVEKYIRGRELTIGILGESPLDVIEIVPKNKYFDFEAKYTRGMTDYLVPAPLGEETARRLKKMAFKVHDILGCEDFSRVDFMLDEEDRAFILEINTIPGFTATSLLPKAAQCGGINFNQLCVKIIELANGKKKENKTGVAAGSD